jgi:hypothetical protein
MAARATKKIAPRTARLIFIGAGYLRAADHTIRRLLVIVNVQVIALLTLRSSARAAFLLRHFLRYQQEELPVLLARSP